jgi:hypothetical protein
MSADPPVPGRIAALVSHVRSIKRHVPPTFISDWQALDAAAELLELQAETNGSLRKIIAHVEAERDAIQQRFVKGGDALEQLVEAYDAERKMLVGKAEAAESALVALRSRLEQMFRAGYSEAVRDMLEDNRADADVAWERYQATSNTASPARPEEEQERLGLPGTPGREDQ